MRSTFAALGLAALAAATPYPQAVTSAILPPTSAPAGCQSSYSGTFEIQVINETTSAKVKRDTVLTLTLSGGILKDAYGRTGYIAANDQFQFDGPPQAGAIYTAGWSVCPNGTLALGGETTFFQCLSGTFYNLYDKSTGAQCSPVYIDVIGAGVTTSVASQYSDGQPQETPVPTPICQYTDGQPQETACAPVSEYTDGQPQAPTGTPVSEYTDGQPQAPTGTPVSEYTDGQPQAPSPTPVCQYTDGQPQETACAPVSEYTDGQPQAPTGTPVSEYTDGQPQAPTGTPVSEYTDGQPQAPTGTPVSEYTDGQPQAPTATPVSQTSDGQIQAATPTTAAYQNAAPAITQGAMGVAAAFLAVLAL